MATSAQEAMSTTSSMKERRRVGREVAEEMVQEFRKLLQNYKMIVANGGEIQCESGEVLTKSDNSRACRQFEGKIRSLPSLLLTRSKRDKTSASRPQFCVVDDQYKAVLLKMIKKCGLDASDVFIDEKRSISERKNLIANLIAIYNLRFSPSQNLGKGKTQSRIISGDDVYDPFFNGDSMFTVGGKAPDQQIKEATSKPGFYEKNAIVSEKPVNRRDSTVEILLSRKPDEGKYPNVSIETINGKRETVAQFGATSAFNSIHTADAEAWYEDDFDKYVDRYQEMVEGLNEFKGKIPNPKKKKMKN